MKRQVIVLLLLGCCLVLGPAAAQARYLNPNTGRFQTMDSYEGNTQDPASLHKYLYAHANPVNGIDPSGQRLIPPSDPNDLAAYQDALKYLAKSATAQKVIAQLEKSDENYTITCRWNPTSFSEGPEYSPTNRTIFWKPNDALEWKTWAFGRMRHMTPALMLLHEMGHAFHHDLNAKEFERLGSTEDTGFRWDNLEEKRTVKEIEVPAARELGEDTRNWHNTRVLSYFRLYISAGSTSLREIIPSFTLP
jgi:hypothetical protein